MLTSKRCAEWKLHTCAPQLFVTEAVSPTCSGLAAGVAHNVHQLGVLALWGAGAQGVDSSGKLAHQGLGKFPAEIDPVLVPAQWTQGNFNLRP